MQRPLLVTAILGLVVVPALAGLPALAGMGEGIVAYDRGDFATAYQELMPAAEGGHPVAQYRLGRMRDDGNGIGRDYGVAADWYLKAAARGHAEAQYDLGSLYARGRGVPVDLAAAAKWHRRAADQGHVRAQGALGGIYAQGGDGVAADFVKAWKWLAIAGRAGAVGATLSLPSVEAQMTPAELAKAKMLAAKFRPRPE